MHTLIRAAVRLSPVVLVAILAYLWTNRPPRPHAESPEAAAVQRSIKQLKHPNPDRRREAAESLAELGPEAAPAARALVAALKDRDVAVQRAAARAVRQLGPPAAPALVAALRGENQPHRFRCACLLSEVDPRDPAGVRVLIEALHDQALQIESVAALLRIGVPAVEPLGRALKDANPAVRRVAADTLRDLGAPAQTAVTPLIEALQDPVPFVRLAAARALGAIRPEPRAAVAALLACPTDGEPRLREEVTEALVQFGPAAVTELNAGLDDPMPACRAAAARALARLGPLPGPVLGRLVHLLDNSNPQVRRESARALIAVDQQSPRAVAVLAEGLHDPDGRYDILRVLRHCGPIGRAALVAALKDADPALRGETARALGQFGAEAKDTIPALIETLQDPDRTVRREAAHALGRIGFATAVPALIPVLQDGWEVNRGEAAIALSFFGPAARDAVPALIANLVDESLLASREAEKALVEIGRDALPALRATVDGPNPALAQAASEVVKKINSKPGND